MGVSSEHHAGSVFAEIISMLYEDFAERGRESGDMMNIFEYFYTIDKSLLYVYLSCNLQFHDDNKMK